ncbi:MAG: hypothetical protein WBO00_01260 [Steroidobacteraceae bacterium]
MNIEYPEWMAKYQKPEVLAGGAVLILVLVLALAWTAWRWNIALDRMEMMEAQAAVGFLQPPSSTRTLLVNPRAGNLTGIDAGGLAKRIDLTIAVNSDRFARYRIALLRDDGTAILHVERLVPDSNGALHLGFNSTLLPNGIYRLRVEGYTRRGKLEKYAESRLGVGGR